MSTSQSNTIHPTSASADVIVTSPNSTTEHAVWFATKCEEANLIRRAAFRLRDYFGYDPRSHLDRYGNSCGVPEQDPVEHEELADFAEAILKECDEFIAVYGYMGSPVRRADLVWGMSIEAYLAGHDAGRIERAARLMLVDFESLGGKLYQYKTTHESCGCPDKRLGGDRLCKHQIALRMKERLQKPWNEQVVTFQPSAIDVDDIEIPF